MISGYALQVERNIIMLPVFCCVVLTCATSELDVMVGCGKQPPNSACFRLVSLNHLLAGVITASILSHTRILPIREEAAHHLHPLNMQFIKPLTASHASHINAILWRDEAFTRFMPCCQMNSHADVFLYFNDRWQWHTCRAEPSRRY